MKIIKKLLCLTLAFSMCASLIGCNVIDEMRQAQIHFNKKGNLVYNDKEYKVLPSCDALAVEYALNKNLYITQKDVPVLLSTQFGERAFLSDDELFIDSYTKDASSATYCRSDIYDKIAKRISDGNYFEGFCFYYSYYDEDDDVPSYKHECKIISEEAEKAITQIITTFTPDEDVDIDLLYPYSVTDLYACSDDLLFKEYSVTIFKTEKFIYLSASTGLNKELVYKVDELHYNAINEVIESHKALETKYNKYPTIE